MTTVSQGGGPAVVSRANLPQHSLLSFPRIVHLERCPTGGFGFEIIGDGPFFVHKVYGAAKVCLTDDFVH